MKFLITMNRHLLLWVFAGVFGIMATGRAQSPIFRDDFGSGNLDNWSKTSGGTNGAVIIDETTSPPNPFGGYAVRFYDLGGNSNTFQKNYSTTATLQLFQFDAAIATGAASSSSAAETYFRVMNSGMDATSSTKTPFTIAFRMDGTIVVSSQTISFGTSGVRLSIYTNTGASQTIASIYGDTLTVGANQYAVYSGSTLVGVFGFSGSATNFTASNGIQTFAFYSTSTNTGSDFVFDNFSVTDVLAVPESPTSAFFLLGAAACLAFGRRAHKAIF